MFTQEQEVKRSKEWKVVMAISSILIIVIAVFFLFRMFHSNPLEGTWVNEENDMTLKIKADQITSSYDYSVEQDEMTLTEREYGDQLTFVKK